MANLTSSSTPSTSADGPVQLSGPENVQLWLDSIKNFANTAGGKTGQNLFSPEGIILDYLPPGKEPKETDLITNPMTGAEVPGQLQYTRNPIPTSTDGATDYASIWDQSMTDFARGQFSKDTANYIARSEKFRTQTNILRATDDKILARIQSSIPIHLRSTVATHTDFETFSTRDTDYYYRSKDYIKMVTAIFSTGSVKLQTANLLRALNSPQGLQPFPQFLASHNLNWPLTKSSIESPDHKGYVSLDTLEYMLLTNNINKTSIANSTALNNYYLQNSLAMLPKALIQELVTQNIQHPDPDSDTTSHQGSALAATATALAAAPTAKKYGAKKHGREDHCTSCHSLTKGTTVVREDGITYKGPFFIYGHSATNCHRRKHAEDKAKALLAAAPAATAPAAAQHADLHLAIRSVITSMCNDDSLSILTTQQP